MKMADCHPEKKHLARGFCSACYSRWFSRQNPERARARWKRSWDNNREERLKRYKTKVAKNEAFVLRHRANNLKYRLKHAERIKERKRFAYCDPERKARRLAWKYGVHIREIYRLLAITVCEICGSDKQLHIDHDHVKGHIRGRLCGNCNKAIGLLNDDAEKVLAVFRYLKKDENTLRLVS